MYKSCAAKLRAGLIQLIVMNNSTNLEIERKFLIDLAKLPFDLNSFAHAEILQGYIVCSADSAVRLRKKGEQFQITVKSGKGLTRNEHEGEISEKTFAALWPTTEGKRIQKTRYVITGKEPFAITIDVFHKSREGLVVAEVEFQSESQALSFIPPKWFGTEVTEIVEYSNALLVE